MVWKVAWWCGRWRGGVEGGVVVEKIEWCVRVLKLVVSERKNGWDGSGDKSGLW